MNAIQQFFSELFLAQVRSPTAIELPQKYKQMCLCHKIPNN